MAGADPLVDFPRVGDDVWDDGSLASAIINAEFFGSLDVPSIGAATSKGYDNSTTATTAALTTQASTALLVFAQWETTSTPPTITDSKGNTFGAPFRTVAPGAGSIPNYLGAWFLPTATGGSAHTFTATGGASTFPSIWVVEVPLAATITHTGAGAVASPYNSGNLVTTGDTRLVGFAGAENTTTVVQTVNSAGFTKVPGTEITDGAAAWTGVVAQREAVAGTYSFEVGVTSSQDGGAILVALSKSAGAVDGTAPSAALTATSALSAPTATGVRNATAPTASLTATSALSASTATGVRNASAPAAGLTATQSLSASAATGQVNGTASGAALTASTALVAPSATAGVNGTAPAAALTATASYAGSTATGQRSPTAPAATLSAALSLAVTAATGVRSPTAPSAALGATHTLSAPTATGQRSPTAPAAALTATTALVAPPAAIQQNGTAPNVALGATSSLSAATATGTRSATAPAATLSASAGLAATTASGTRSATAPAASLSAAPTLTVVPGTGGATAPTAALSASATLQTSTATAGIDVTAPFALLALAATLFAPAAIAGIDGTAPAADLYVGGAGGGGTCVVIVDIPGTGPSASVTDPQQVVVTVPVVTQVVSVGSAAAPVVQVGSPSLSVDVTVVQPVVDVNASTTPITIEGDGLQGPPGAPGAPGAGYTHVQSTPSTQWVINHNLGINPSVELLTAGGVEFEAEVVHTSVNQTLVNIAIPLAGSARLA